MKKMPKENRFSWILWGFFYFFIFTMILRGSFAYLDPDLGWHLKVGEEIAQTRSVPDVNHYNYTFTGNWVDHEWLSNLAVYEIYDHFGYIALSVLFALLIVAILIILNLWTKHVCPGASSFFIVIFQLLGVVAASPHFGVRMQESGLLFLSFILLVIYHYNKHRDWRLLLLLVPIMYLWSCLHASFLIGFAIFLAWIGVKVFERIISRHFKKDWLDYSSVLEWKEIMAFSAVSVLSVAATMFTPYRLKLYSFLTGYKDNFYQSHIQEWLPQYQYPFEYSQLFYLALVLLAIVFYIYHSRGNKRYWRIDLWTIGLVVIFVFLSFKSHRHFPLLFVASFTFLINVFSSVFRSPSGRESHNQDWPQNNWLKWYLLLCLFLCALLQLSMTNFTKDPFRSFRRSYPVGAAEFLKERPQYDSARIFNDYGWGGFLIWKMPERRLFIDGRLPQVEYQGQTFLEEYFDFFHKETDISGKLKDYGIGLVLMPIKDEEIRAKKWEQILFSMGNQNMASHNYLRDYLAGSDDWQPIYYDKTAIIYERIR